MYSAESAVARCPSVHPTVCHTPVFSRNGSRFKFQVQDTTKLFSPSGRHTILLFAAPNSMVTFRRGMQRVWEKNDFRPISCYISENIQNTAIVRPTIDVWEKNDFRPISCYISETIQNTAIYACGDFVRHDVLTFIHLVFSDVSLVNSGWWCIYSPVTFFQSALVFSCKCVVFLCLRVFYNAKMLQLWDCVCRCYIAVL